MKEIDKQSWLEARRKGLGGSDAPAILGVSPWKTPYQVYLDKRGEGGTIEDNEPMFWGRTLEPVIRQRYSDVTGKTVTVPNAILVHPENDWMIGNVDGLVEDERRVLEVKTSRSSMGWGEPGTDEIPESYLVQVQHYLAVTSYDVADVAALISGNDFRLYEVPADKELQDIIIEREAKFWDMVQKGTPPDPVTFADLKIRFGSASKAKTVQANDAALKAIDRLKTLKEYSKEENELKAVIMKALGEADTLVDGNTVLCTWKAGKPSKRLDMTAFKNELPEVYERFLKEGEPTRRFLIK